MGEIKVPEPVKYFVSMISADEAGFDLAMEKLAARFGGFDLVSDIIPFDFTDYYREEMGEGLLRRFASFENLMDPEILADVKIFTNNLEEEMGGARDGRLCRRVNLDAGYLTLAKLILASTKDFSHRIYLRDGIFAEITLAWRKGGFIHFDYTFPDYRTDFYKNFFTLVREKFYFQKNAGKNKI